MPRSTADIQKSFVVRRDVTLKNISAGADAYTGKSKRVMDKRWAQYSRQHNAHTAADRRREIWHIDATFGNAWEAHENMFAVRTPSSRKPWDKNSRQGAKRVKKFERLEKDGPELSPADATMFRALAARANYLAQDRPDLAFAAKEVCREFAVPTRRSWERLEKVCRYICGVPRLVYKYPFQSMPPT